MNVKKALIGLACGAACLALGGSPHFVLPSATRPVSASGFAAVVSGAVVTQGFGCTPVLMEPVDLACATGHFHSGIDLAAAYDTPVFAPAGGSAAVIESATGYGLHVTIQHSTSLMSLYGHLAAVTVRDGEAVAAGQQIGLLGSSGMSTGPHVHFEIRNQGVPVDPSQWLPVVEAVAGGSAGGRGRGERSR